MKQLSKKIKFIIKIEIQQIIALLSYTFTSKKEKKIVIGVNEIANILFNSKKIFEEKCIVVCKGRNRFYSDNIYDVDLSRKKGLSGIIISSYCFGKLAKNAIFFMYFWNDGFLINREFDFQFLKKHNIPIICNFLGSDIRSRKLLLEYCKSVNLNTFIEYDRPEYFLSDAYDMEKKKIAEQADKYATIIFSHKIDQYSYLKKPQFFFPPLIDENIFSNNLNKFELLPIKILHAPSSPVIKGTPLVRCVVKQLKNEGFNFEYIELMNKTNKEVIKELKESHIVLNQFYLFLPGIFGLEAMATCNAVLMSAKPEHFPYTFNDAWMETEDWQLYNNLKYLLNNPERIIEYAKNGFNYIRNNFSREAIANYLNKIFIQHGIIF